MDTHIHILIPTPSYSFLHISFIIQPFKVTVRSIVISLLSAEFCVKSVPGVKLLPQPLKFCPESSDNLVVIGYDDIFLVASDGIACPVEGTIDKQLAIHQHKLMVHEVGGVVSSYTDS